MGQRNWSRAPATAVKNWQPGRRVVDESTAVLSVEWSRRVSAASPATMLANYVPRRRAWPRCSLSAAQRLSRYCSSSSSAAVASRGIDLVARAEALDVRLTAKERAFLLDEFARARQQLILYFRVKLSFWRQLPWVLFGLVAQHFLAL